MEICCTGPLSKLQFNLKIHQKTYHMKEIALSSNRAPCRKTLSHHMRHCYRLIDGAFRLRMTLDCRSENGVIAQLTFSSSLILAAITFLWNQIKVTKFSCWWWNGRYVVSYFPYTELGSNKVHFLSYVYLNKSFGSVLLEVVNIKQNLYSYFIKSTAPALCNQLLDYLWFIQWLQSHCFVLEVWSVQN